MTATPRILIVDDLSENLNVLTDVLEAAFYEVLAAPSGEIAITILQETQVDLILLDVIMPVMDGIETCRRIGYLIPQPPPIIFISASHDVEQLAEAFAVGGSDYINKPFRSTEVLARVKNQLELARLQTQLQQRNTELELQIAVREKAESALSLASDRLQHICSVEAQRWGLKAFIGSSSRFQQISDQIRTLQGFSKVNVLVLGESGSGKELVARALHFGSNKCNKPFIAINCSAISESLAEAEFFGSVKGSFTGATENRKGFFEMADGGTLFLDEVGDLPLALQAKLLRALENGQFYPVGSKDLKQVEVRVISATNIDLKQRQLDRLFREDLYFRLAQFTVTLPPLRERLDDIEGLALHFVQSFAQDMKIPTPQLSENVLKKLRCYSYPGNIRELKNLMERAVITSQGGPVEDYHIQLPSPTALNPIADNTSELDLKEIKKHLAQQALAKCEGNVTAAAKMIGVHRSWFYRLDK